MDSIQNEIFNTFDNLMQNLNLEYEIDDLQHLVYEDIYLEIFGTMFPMLMKSLMEIASQPEHEPGEKIQYLIELLSTEILNLDLSHIRGNISIVFLCNLKLLLSENRLIDRERRFEAYFKLPAIVA